MLEQWPGDDVAARRAGVLPRAAPSQATEVARRLAEEHAISVRAGFVLRASARAPTCAHASRGAGNGAVRASLGLGSGIDDIDELADALGTLIAAHTRRARRPRLALTR